MLNGVTTAQYYSNAWKQEIPTECGTHSNSVVKWCLGHRHWHVLSELSAALRDIHTGYGMKQKRAVSY